MRVHQENGDVETSVTVCPCGTTWGDEGNPERAPDECQTNKREAEKSPGIIDGRLWWEQSSEYWELPFYTEAGIFGGDAVLPDRDDWLAAREQLWSSREGLTDS